MRDIIYGEYLVHVGDTAEEVRERYGADTEGRYLRLAEEIWQIARDPECLPQSRISALRRMSEGGVPVQLLQDMWRYTGGEDQLFISAMAQAFIECLRQTPVGRET